MSFEITLQPPRPSYPTQPTNTYHPGQTLTGVLTYTLPKQRTLTSITLTLRGKLETNYTETRTSSGAGLTHGPRRPMQEIIRLFSDTRTLFRGPYDVPPQKFEWDFEFNIPTNVLYKRTRDRTGESRGFIEDGWGELPPSFDFVDRTMVHDASAKIRYKIVATAEGKGIFGGGDDEKEWPINIRKVSSTVEPELRLERSNFGNGVSWRSHKLRPEGDKLTVRQRLRSVVSDKDPELRTPGINFQAFVGMPRRFSASQRFGVEFGLVYSKVEEQDPEKPKLILDSLKLAMKARTQMRVKRGGFVGMTITGDRQCEGRYLVAERTARLGGSEGLLLPLDGTTVQVRDMCVGEWRDGEVASLSGNFATWTINYGYWFNAEASVRHVESGKTWTLQTGFPVELRDAYVPELAFVRDKNHAPSVNGDGDGDDDLPPGYTDDVQPPAAEGSGSRRAEGGPSTDEKRRIDD